MSQLAFTLPHRPASGRQDFLVAPCNEAALRWVDAWPDWPAPALVLAGPAASGKSHLAAVWRALSGAAALSADALGAPDRAFGGARAAVLEDLAPGGFDEEGLLHLYNLTREAGGHLLITADRPPARWAIGLADLRSRLHAAPVAEIGPPDETLLSALLVKQLADRQIAPAAEAVRYLVPRMPRSFAGVAALVAALDEASLAQKRAITLPLARSVLEKLSPDPEPWC